MGPRLFIYFLNLKLMVVCINYKNIIICDVFYPLKKIILVVALESQQCNTSGSSCLGYRWVGW